MQWRSPDHSESWELLERDRAEDGIGGYINLGRKQGKTSSVLSMIWGSHVVSIIHSTEAMDRGILRLDGTVATRYIIYSRSSLRDTLVRKE